MPMAVLAPVAAAAASSAIGAGISAMTAKGGGQSTENGGIESTLGGQEDLGGAMQMANPSGGGAGGMVKSQLFQKRPNSGFSF